MLCLGAEIHVKLFGNEGRTIKGSFMNCKVIDLGLDDEDRLRAVTR